MGRFAILAVIALITIVAVLQQMPQPPASQAAGQPPLAPGGAVNPPPVSKQTELIAKASAKLYFLAHDPSKPTPESRRLADQTVDAMRAAAKEDIHDHVRLAMLRGAMEGDEAALEELEQIEAKLRISDPALSAPEDPESDPPAEAAEPVTTPPAAIEAPEIPEPLLTELEQDLATLREIYAGNPPSAAEADRLEARHGWFGELAATHHLPPSDPARKELIGGGGKLMAAIIALGLFVLLAFVAGVTLFIVGIVRASTGMLISRFAPPLPGGSIAAETVAVFVAGFILLKVATSIVALNAGDEVALWFALTAQWLLAALIFYPIVRGVPAQQWLYLVGFHRGRGFFREIGAGVVGYLACLPLLAAGVLFTLIVVLVQGAIAQAQGKTPPTPQNEIIELAGGGAGSAAVFMLFFLASLWAPLVEEAIFRGALYRHLRGWWHWLPAGVVTALAFGLMHGYPLLMLGPVIALGFGFAMIREWRGSLIACMTAHCIHNAGVLLVLLTFFRIIGM